jgi:hypothetical protein
VLEDIKVTIDKFGGLYLRGAADTIPPDHMGVCQNATFNRNEIRGRDGTVLSMTMSFRPRKIFGGVVGLDRFFLLLDDLSQVHRDDGPSIMDGLPDMSDFSALNLYNRIYLAPNRATWADTSYQFVQVYTGTGSTRKAAGTKPASGVTAANGAAGVVSKGIHQIGVCFVTDTGFITPPNATLTSYNAPGSLQVDLSAIPIGASHITGRRIVSTKAGEEELFFVPGLGVINNNTATTITLDFADTDLVVSADYLLDIYEEIPSGTQLVFYKGRLIVVGANSLAIVSNVGDPETFSTVDGFLALPTEDSTLNRPVAGWVLRDTLYISKFPGVFGAQDNGDLNPSNWPVTTIDESIGCYPNGIGSYTAQYSGRSSSDHNIILTQQGVALFDGVFRRPMMSWKVEDFWTSVVQGQINHPLGVNLDFWKFTVSHDVVTKKFYINCATAPTDAQGIGQEWFILHGDSSEGWDAVNIKWSLWSMPFRPAEAVMALHPVDDKYTLRITSFLDNKIWSLDPDATDDVGTNITTILETGLVELATGVLTHFLGVQLRAKGVTALTVKFTDDVLSYTSAAALNISTSVMRDYLRLMNFTSEKTKLYLSGGSQLTINRIEIKGKPTFLQRPPTQ